jgi:hypothetical protein
VVKAEKVKKDARDYLPWAGWFIDSKQDPEPFAMLPGWRQRESRYVRDRVRSGLPLDPQDLLRFQQGSKTDLHIFVPNVLSLASLKRREVGDGTVDASLLPQLKTALDYDWLVREITALGEGRTLVRTKPLQGVLAYIWSLALVRKKEIPALPVNAYWDLEEGIHEITGERIVTADPGATPILEWINAQTERLVAAVA